LHKRYVSIGASILLIFLILGFFGYLLAPYDSEKTTGEPLASPSSKHWLGTNDLGQDILSQVILGTRYSLTIALVAGLLSTGLGVLVGMIAGYSRGYLGAFLNQSLNIIITVPDLLLSILIATFLGPSLPSIIIALSITSWPMEAKIIRAQTLVVKKRQHIEAARLFGASAAHILRKHIFVELLPLIGVGLVMQSSRSILTESTLAFLGLGDVSSPSWGMIIRDALDYKAIYFSPAWVWWLIPPGLCIALFVLALNYSGAHLEKVANRELQGDEAYVAAG
jgi:peptide/nickel transport system permease protein